jgi:hypothetical protein
MPVIAFDWKKLSIRIGVIIGVITILGMLYQGADYLRCRLAWAEDVQVLQQTVQKLNIRLDRKIAQDKVSYTQERVWKLEDRYKDRPMTEEAKDIYRRLQTDLKDALQKLDAIKD